MKILIYFHTVKGEEKKTLPIFVIVVLYCTLLCIATLSTFKGTGISQNVVLLLNILN